MTLLREEVGKGKRRRMKRRRKMKTTRRKTKRVSEAPAKQQTLGAPRKEQETARETPSGRELEEGTVRWHSRVERDRDEGMPRTRGLGEVQ